LGKDSRFWNLRSEIPEGEPEAAGYDWRFKDGPLGALNPPGCLEHEEQRWKA